ncbi:MAG: FliI/YscN family ATPase [Dethiobacteria bacterium]|jgi:flagellum-specific ATP synthase/type III secretion protein N (ATPase)|nr:FliI/YscN family ATPase [Bacillota bacterium]HOP68868.1 FliI/YscN family ATPase [Bacillota bacterium]
MESTSAPVDGNKYLSSLAAYRGGRLSGRVRQVVGLVMEVSGIRSFIGEICQIKTTSGSMISAEVVGFRDQYSLLMPLGHLKGISPGCPVFPTGSAFTVRVGEKLLGKVLDGMGRLLDSGEPPLLPGEGEEYLVDNNPPNPLSRKPIDQVLVTGIKAIDGLLTIGQGQRIGIFSGSGVGKSSLLGMIARRSEADVNVIALIGERGREIGDFLRNNLGPEGLKRSVVVASTSDRSPLERIRGGLVAVTIAEYFRDQGANVVFVMDSVTRFCMAQREIGLAVGEPPTARGYTPSVFALLPRFLERTGTSPRGSITGFYTVLVDGDDFTEPITDAVRGILDGHIILDRNIAARNHYPAIDILRSTSRLMPALADPEHMERAAEVKTLLATYQQVEDLINIGAYKPGTRPEIDRAIEKREEILDFLRQGLEQSFRWEETMDQLAGLVQ